ncbi:hypothetical protein [Flavobacterium aquariorum]|uniref:hypothetical protein n=1 Tax=Flavobacterium aquariorum TaxID=2217670 RepID=UPI001403BC89|nr:hypothetical protein [Flavobacterium aquariorum]
MPNKLLGDFVRLGLNANTINIVGFASVPIQVNSIKIGLGLPPKNDNIKSKKAINK